MWTGVGGGEGESKIDENVWISFVNDLYSKKKTSVDTFKNTGEKDEEKKRQLQSLLRYTHAQKMILIENLVFSFVVTISRQRRIQKPVKYLRWNVLRSLLNI